MTRTRRQPATRLVLATPDGMVGIGLDLLGRLEPVGAVLAVPGAPASIAGVAEIRGRVVTLLDPFPWLLERQESSPHASERPGSLPTSALIFAPPFEHLALLVPAGSTLLLPEPQQRLNRVLSNTALEARLEGITRQLRTKRPA